MTLEANVQKKSILFWGRFDPDYSRNRILRQILKEQGWSVCDFQPFFSRFANLEAQVKGIKRPDLVWVPCFRQRDISTAVKWAGRHSVPIIIDPLISAYDKQVYERKKITENSPKAKRLMAWESGLFQSASLVVADTYEHACFFSEKLGVDQKKIAVVPVGAEEAIFNTGEVASDPTISPLKVLFYGSFLKLQGPEFIAQAAGLYSGPPVKWIMVGDGPELESCKRVSAAQENIEFSPWVAYEALPDLIRSSDILLGIFGMTAKASRVIPNKVYQSLACGKPLLTRASKAYPEAILNDSDCGIRFVEPGDPEDLAKAVAELASRPEKLTEMGQQARLTYERFFSNAQISQMLHNALEKILKVEE